MGSLAQGGRIVEILRSQHGRYYWQGVSGMGQSRWAEEAAFEFMYATAAEYALSLIHI